MTPYYFPHFLLQSLESPYVINEQFLHYLFFCEFFLIKKYQISSFPWFERVKSLLFDEWRCDCFHVRLILIKVWFFPFYQFKINTHWDSVSNIRRASENVSDFFLWNNLKRSILLNFPRLNHVQLFKDSCLEISTNILYRKTSILDSFCKLEETLRTEIQICFVQSFLFLFGCFFGWNRFWCSSENLTT